MTEYDQKITIGGQMFSQMRSDANVILQKLLKNMVDKQTNEGSMTIKIDVALRQEYIPIPPEERQDAGPETRRILKPVFEHKISSTMQVRDSANGRSQSDFMELEYDSETDAYILTPSTGNDQMNIYDVIEDDPQDDGVPNLEDAMNAPEIPDDNGPYGYAYDDPDPDYVL